MSPRTPAPPPGEGTIATILRIRAMCEAAGMSGKRLATQIGRSQNYVAKRFRLQGEFTLSDIDRIAAALGMHRSALMQLDDSRPV